MPYSVRCKACSSAFAIPDEIWDKRVRGRIATLKCRNCKAEIQVDGSKPGVVQISAAPPAAAEPAPVAVPAAAPLPVIAEPASPTVQTKDATPLAASESKEASSKIRPAVTSSTTKAPSPVAPAPSKMEAGAKRASDIRSPSPPTASVLSHKPAAKTAEDITAPETGWSLMPPAADLEQVGILPKPATGRSNLSSPRAPTAAAATTTAATPAGPAPAAAMAGTKQQPTPISVAPEQVAPDELIQDGAADPDLWVVSYGENDDRELTEKEIAAELTKGTVTLSTIVWQEGMPEWLPISGVRQLAKYAPVPKAAATRQARPTAMSRSVAQQPRVNVLATTKADSPVARQAAHGREKQPSSSQLEPKSSPKRGIADTPAQAHNDTVAAETRSQAKGPPPLLRTGEKSADAKSIAVADRSADKSRPTATAAKALHGQSVELSMDPLEPSQPAPLAASKPPALRRAQPAVAAKVAFTLDDDPHDGVFTSAPDVGATMQAQVAASGGKVPATAVTPATTATPRAAPSASASVAAPKSVPSQRPVSKTSFRPPKPVETATSTVMRTESAARQDLLITDEDFLAMQRRFPKWALPAAIAGAVVVIGAIVYAANSTEELPPLPVAPVVDPNMALRENPANQAQPKHPQPNLDALPTATNRTINSEEKDFARLFAQSASKTNGTFDSKAAEHAAMNFMELAARCRVAPEPAGQARVVITFSTAGQVVSVQVGSPYAGTATGKCIDKALRNIKTRAFQGEPGRLPLTVPIH